MAYSKKTTKQIYAYLKDLGVDDLTNSFLVDEFEAIEKLVRDFEADLKENGKYDAKGKLSAAFHGYNTMLGKKSLFLQKLAMTVLDRSKLKSRPKEDAVQLEFENFMRKVS